MASAVDQLEALFQRAESDLSYVHRKLDTQLSAKYETIGHGQVRYDSDCLKKSILRTIVVLIFTFAKDAARVVVAPVAGKWG